MINQDSNIFRKLKDNAVPTKFRNCPRYMSCTQHSKQTTKCFADVRRQKEINNMEQLNQEFSEKDKVGFVHEIVDLILSDSATPSDLTTLLKDDTFFTVYV